MRESKVTDATKQEERLFKRIKEFLQQPQVTPYEFKKTPALPAEKPGNK